MLVAVKVLALQLAALAILVGWCLLGCPTAAVMHNALKQETAAVMSLQLAVIQVYCCQTR